MCSGNLKSLGASTPAPTPSPFEGNYGYGKTSNAPVVSESERQWYITQGYGDPNKTYQAPSSPNTNPYNLAFRNPLAIQQEPGPTYYRGVDPGARQKYMEYQSVEAGKATPHMRTWGPGTLTIKTAPIPVA